MLKSQHQISQLLTRRDSPLGYLLSLVAFQLVMMGCYIEMDLFGLPYLPRTGTVLNSLGA